MFVARGWSERSSVLTIIGAGIALRLLFLAFVPYESGGSEAEDIAIALAKGRGFADAYFVGSGPTAHLTPTTPVLAGLVYRMFGIQSFPANAILVTWSLICFSASALMLNRLFRILGAALPARLLGLAVMCLLPVFLLHETLVFRFWEGQATFALLLASMSRSIEQATAPPDTRGSVISSLLLALIFLLNPVVGLAAGLGHVAALIGKRPLVLLARDGVLAVAIVSLPPAGWAARNQRVLGAPIFLRDNVGLELSFKNNDLVLRKGPDAEILRAIYARVHPSEGGAGSKRLRAVGELAYLGELKQQSFAWIATHPGGFLSIAARGWVEFFFPPPRHFGRGGGPRTALIWLVDAVGLTVVALAILRRRHGWFALGTVIVSLSLVYAPFIYLWRYHYPVYNLLLFAGACGAWTLVRRWDVERSAHVVPV